MRRLYKVRTLAICISLQKPLIRSLHVIAGEPSNNTNIARDGSRTSTSCVNLSSRADGRTKLASIPCRYYTKTGKFERTASPLNLGRCNRALTCPYRHDAKRLAICPQFLRGVCPNTAESCPLSHNPSPHNTPSCLHFQTSSTCRNGSGCKYPHVRVASDAPICEGFARAGWCDETPGTCPNLHLWECGEWREKGTCSRGAKCGLRHILRAEQAKAILSSGGDFEQNDDFVNLGHGSPALVQSDESDEDRDEESDAGTDPSSSTGESDVYSEIDIVG